MKTTYFSYFLLIFLSFSGYSIAQKKLVILHTNDTHSRIEPLPETDKTAPDKGGVVRRATFVDEIRRENKNVLLLDAGDFLQGTPYFNLFKGKVEVEAMNLMKYDAATIGNHEFDYGLDVLEDVARKANFPIVSSNYDFSATALANFIKPYTIIKKDGVRIGILGLGISPRGLIATNNYGGMKFLDPIATANRVAKELRETHKCDMVVCISHLGYTNDLKLAESTRNIDLILGGHSHTYLKEPKVRKNADNKDVLIYQTSGRGVFVGKIDVEFEKIRK